MAATGKEPSVASVSSEAKRCTRKMPRMIASTPVKCDKISLTV
jgi:hypothetical protein